MPLVLDGTNGVSGVDGTASNPAIEGTDSNTGIFYPAADTVAIGTGGTEALRVNSSQNVGIGTSSPANKLHVVGTAASNLIRAQAASSGDSVVLRPNAAGNGGDVFSVNDAQTAYTPLNVIGSTVVFLSGTGGTERARITSAGEFLVGKTSTSDAVVGVSISSAGAVAQTNAASTNATVVSAVYSTGASNYRFYVGMGGTVYATSTTITAISDQRLKENIQDIDAGLDKIMALKPRKFDWKEGKGKDKKGDRGWIAQEFEQVFPEMIDTWLDPAPEGEEPYKAVNADLIPVLVKAIQELNAKVEAQAAEIAALKGNA